MIPQAFCRGCPQLAEVELAHVERLTSIAGQAFEDCPALLAPESSRNVPYGRPVVLTNESCLSDRETTAPIAT